MERVKRKGIVVKTITLLHCVGSSSYPTLPYPTPLTSHLLPPLKFHDAIEKHDLEDDLKDKRVKLVGEKFTHAVEHSHDAKDISERDDKISELEAEVENFKLKVDVLKQQLVDGKVRKARFAGNWGPIPRVAHF